MKTLRLFVVLLAFTACKKDASSTGDQSIPADLKPTPAKVDVATLKAPALFASIPADSPYVLAAFEAVPLDYYRKIKAAVGPSLSNSLNQLRAMEADGKPGLLDAIMTELDGKWNVAGLESLGLSATPRFALYGLGIAPVVFRLEVKDDKAVRATVERIATKAGHTLPETKTLDGRDYWMIAKDDTAFVVAFADSQLIAAFGPTTALEAKLKLILGLEKPAQNMADGTTLSNLMTKHGFGPHLIGFADTKLLATQGMAFANKQASPACTSELDRLSAIAPRVVVGYGEINTKRATGGMVLELAPAALKVLEALKTEVPGLGPAIAGDPLMAMGGGFDLVGGQKLGVSIASAMGNLGTVCDLADVTRAAGEMADALGNPLPPAAAGIRGGVVVVQSVKFGANARSNPLPEDMEAFALVSSSDAKAMVEQLMTMVPPLRQMGLETDGKLHAVGGGMLPIPFEVQAGVGAQAVVLGVGSEGRKMAERTIDASGGGKVPFLVMSYDYGKFLELRAKLMPDGTDDIAGTKQMNDDLSKIFGRTSMHVDVNDKGLMMWGSIEMK